MSTMLVDLGGTPGTAASGPDAPAAVGTVLAQDPSPPPGQGAEFGKASPVALVVILLLAAATVLLIRSMAKRIRRLPASFDRPDDAPPADAERGVEDAGGNRA
jgi:hypothetical protein